MEFGGQAQTCMGISSKEQLQDRDRNTMPHAYDHCERCPILKARGSAHKTGLICDKIDARGGRSLGSRWMVAVHHLAPWVAVMVGEREVSAEVLKKTIAAVLRERATVHVDRLKDQSAIDEQTLHDIAAYPEAGVEKLLDLAEATLSPQNVQDLYRDFLESLELYRKGLGSSGELRRFTQLVAGMLENHLSNLSSTALPTASYRALRNQLAVMLKNKTVLDYIQADAALKQRFTVIR